jgi:alkaline ceramidase
MFYNNLLKLFEYESSKVIWCETKYAYLNEVCEFANTITGIPYVLLSIIGLVNLYNLKKNNKCLFNLKYSYIDQFEYYNLLYYIFIFVGLFTIYFHGTLSYVGQLCDEISILIFISIINTTPEYNPVILLLELPTMIFFPKLNRFTLFFFAIIKSKKIFYVHKTVKNLDIKKLLIRCIILFIFSIIFWLIDIFYCKYLLFSLHWLWHILSSYAGYYIITYVLSINIKSTHKIKINYYCFVPYIHI